MPALLDVIGLTKHFPSPSGAVRAVDGVDLQIHRAHTYGLVGESGCGKSTLIRTIQRLLEPTSGQIIYKGQDIAAYKRAQLRTLRKEMAMVFQDPHMSLNPRMTVFDILARPLQIHGIARGKDALTLRIVHLLQKLGMQSEHLVRFPHELSGGQKQRIGVARALAVEPDIIFLDEPTSALDVSVQTKILKLLENIRKEWELTYFYISHDINLVRVVAEHMGVMYLGKIVEVGRTEDILRDPHHPYTVGLLQAVPEPDPDKPLGELQLGGEVPSPVNPPPGCNFHPRCPHAWDVCSQMEPELRMLSAEWSVACHRYGDDARAAPSR